MTPSWCWARQRIIFFIDIECWKYLSAFQLENAVSGTLILCFMIITRPAWNIKFGNSSRQRDCLVVGEMLMSTSKELKDKYHYFVEREEREAILTGWVTVLQLHKIKRNIFTFCVEF